MSALDSKINVYVSSRYREAGETVSNFHVTIPDGLLKVGPNEFFSLDVNCFHMFNTFYQCNANTNHFQLIFRNQAGQVYATTDMYLTKGSPNVYDVQTNLQSLMTNYATITYDRVSTKYTYTRTYTQSTSYYTMYIKPLGASSFLGLINNVETAISSSGTQSTNPINVIAITTLNVTIDGDISFKNNNIDNVYGFYQNTDIILQKAIDVPKNGLLQYENIDAGDSFHFLLCNVDRIKYFTLQVFDQNMNPISDLPDYDMHLQFIVHQRDKTEKQLHSLIEYTHQSYLILGYILDFIQKLFSKSV